MPYSIVKRDESYVIRVGDQDCLKMSSRRKAAKLICDVRRRESGDCADDGGVDFDFEEND